MEFTYISTDGAVKNAWGGWAFVEHTRKSGSKESIKFQEYGSVMMTKSHEVEIYAIYRALAFVKKRRRQSTAIIYSDNSSAVLAVREVKETGSPLRNLDGWSAEDVDRFQNLLNDKSLVFDIRHMTRCSTTALDRADRLAKRGSKEAQTDAPVHYENIVMSLIKMSTKLYNTAHTNKGLPEFLVWYEEATALRLKALYYIEKMGPDGERFLDLLPTYKSQVEKFSDKAHAVKNPPTTSMDDFLVDDWPDVMPRPTEAVAGDIFTPILGGYEQVNFGFPIR